MLEKLYEAEGQLVDLITDSSVEWKTLDVLYHPPRVERVWCQWNEYRISLHRIHPCKPEEALFHPHPWPSAIYIASGYYEMAVSESTETVAAKLILPAGSYYEMTQPCGYHYVRPLDNPVMSVMISGPPWKTAQEKMDNEEFAKNKPLSDRAKMDILDFFRVHYNVASIMQRLKAKL